MSLEVLGPQHVGMYNHSEHEVITTILGRAASGYTSKQYDDGNVVDFVCEGGGFSGSIPAGGLLVCEQADLVRTFDRGKGTSAGAFNVASTAGGQAAEAVMNYIDLTDKPFAKPIRLMAGRAPANYDHLIRDIMLAKRPYDIAKLEVGPKIGVVAVNLLTKQAEVLQNFDDVPDMLRAIRVSSSMPILAGPPIEYKGAPMSDGALLAAVPFKLALKDAATHVLAFRSCGEDTRKVPESKAQLEVVRRLPWGGEALAELVKGRAKIYNDDAENLQAGDVYPNVLQSVMLGDQRPVERITKSAQQVKHGVQLGADAIGKLLGTPILHVAWMQDKPIVLTDRAISYS